MKVKRAGLERLFILSIFLFFESDWNITFPEFSNIDNHLVCLGVVIRIEFTQTLLSPKMTIQFFFSALLLFLFLVSGHSGALDQFHIDGNHSVYVLFALWSVHTPACNLLRARNV